MLSETFPKRLRELRQSTTRIASLCAYRRPASSVRILDDMPAASFPVPAPASVPRAFDLTSYMGQFHNQLAARTERCEALESELDATKTERDECSTALKATAMSLATAQSELASERVANEELRRQLSEMLSQHQEWKAAMAKNDAELSAMRSKTDREKTQAVERECKRIVDDLKRELRDVKKRAATEKAKMAGELKNAVAMRDAHAAQTEMLLVERNKLSDELMRVRTKAKLAGKVKAANPGLTPSPAPGSAYRSRSRSNNAINDEANAGAHDDRDGNVVLSPFTPSPASTAPGAGTVRRKSRVPELDSAYKASHIGPGRDCTLDATLKEKGWNPNTVKFRVDENGLNVTSPVTPGVTAAMRKKATAEQAKVGLARAGRKPLGPSSVARDAVVSVGIEYPR